MSMDFNKICNIAGYPIYPWAQTQLQKRSQLGSMDTRDDDNILYLANKGAWVRVLSSVNINQYLTEAYTTPGSKTKGNKLVETTVTPKPSGLFKYYQDLVPSLNIQTGLGSTILNETSLAKNFVLYGGTSTWANGQMQLRSGIEPGGAYNVLGNQNEIRDYGYKPMPGITSVTIESTGRLGSLRQATINFKVWDKYQLDLVDALYFRPGFTLLIEYGHAKYYDNDGRLQSSETFMLDPFVSDLTKEDINILISTNVRKSYGNYGGMLGLVTHFDFSMNADGGYDCTVKAMSLGAVMGNFPVNHIDVFSKAFQNQLTQYLDIERGEATTNAQNKIEDERKQAVAIAQKKLNESGDLFAQLKIDDKFTTLLFNTKTIDVFNEYITKSSTTQQSSLVPVSNTSTVEKSPIRNVSPLTATQQAQELANNTTAFISGNYWNTNITPGTLDVNYYKPKVEPLVSTYKSSHDISRSSTSTNVKAYYIESPKIIYFSQLNNKNDAYIGNGTSLGDNHTDIFVKLDIASMNSILTNKTENVLQIKAGVKNQSQWKQSYDNYFDVLTKELILMSGHSYINYTYLGALNPSQTVFTLGVVYPLGKESEAKNYFTNPNTQYKVVEVESNVPINDYQRLITSINLEVIDPENEDASKYRLSLGERSAPAGTSPIADISFIKEISGDQHLTENKTLEDYNNAIVQAQKYSDATNKAKQGEIDATYSAEQVKLATESSSTLELMLRSILLNEINQVYYSGKGPDSKFINDLFSEGCYATFFSGGVPKKMSDKDLTDKFKKYADGTLSANERLEINLHFGNNHSLMSGEDFFDTNGQLKDTLHITPQVDFDQLFKFYINIIGETTDIGINEAAEKNLSVYIPLGLFFLFLNHTAMLYNSENAAKLEKGSTIIPMTYIDFNPDTSFFLSNASQMSLDPFKFLVPFMGGNEHYDALFSNSKNRRLTYDNKDNKNKVDPEDLFDFSTDNELSKHLNTAFKNPLGEQTPNGYVGKLMYVMTDINYLLKIIKTHKSNSDTGDVYFQSIVEQILTDLNKSMGNYNAFRLSYNDASNCFVITDDQIQGAVDSKATGAWQDAIQGAAFEIPVFGKSSIARSFEMRTDMSGRIASMLAISANQVPGNQVAAARNTSDFGVYNAGTYDRYVKSVTDSPVSETGSLDNFAEFEAQVNFNKTVRTIYSEKQITQEDLKDSKKDNMSPESVSRALSYYTNRLAKKKNHDLGSTTAMIIPLKTNITMDGMSGLYPFQLYTVSENVMPYRYSKANLGQNKRPAFSIARMTHVISNNEWTTSVEGFMTLMRDQRDYDNRLSTISHENHKFIPIIQPTEQQIGAVEITENANKIYDFFIDHNFTPAVASGFVGNFYQESGWNPNAKNSIGAYGIAQWLEDRKSKLLLHPNPTDLMTQLNFVIEELDSTEKNTFLKLKNVTTPQEATYIIRKYYERPSKTEANDPARIVAAVKIFKDKNPTV